MKTIMLWFFSIVLSISVYAGENQFEKDSLTDDLLDNLVGIWDVTAVVHGQSFKLKMDVSWVANHQYLKVHEISDEVVPWLGGTLYEENMFIGYNHAHKRYVIMEISVEGSDGYEGYCYAVRYNKQLKLTKNDENGNPFGVQTMDWDSSGKTWTIQAKLIENGKEGQVVIEKKAVPAK